MKTQGVLMRLLNFMDTMPKLLFIKLYQTTNFNEMNYRLKISRN